MQMHVGRAVPSALVNSARSAVLSVVLLTFSVPAMAQVEDSPEEDGSQGFFVLTPPEASVSAELRDFQRALNAYRAETEEFQEDLDRLIETEYESRRNQIQESYDWRIENARAEERELRSNAIGQLEAFIAAYPDSEPATPDALLRLAQLTFEQETEAFLLADDEYTEALGLHDSGQIPDLPEQPLRDFTQTASVCRQLITAFPVYRQVDGAHYLLGYVSLVMGLDDDAVEVFSDLVSWFPDSEFATEAWLRLGEVYFDRNDYQTAVAAYRRASADVENRLFDEALFKLGWSFYLSNQYAESLETFTRLVEHYDSGGGQMSGALRQEAVRYTALILAEEDWDMDGIPDPEGGLARLGGLLTGEVDWELEVADQIVDVWLELDLFGQAAGLLGHILHVWPNDSSSPARHARLGQSLFRLGEVEQAVETQRVIATLYRRDSDFVRLLEQQGDILAIYEAENTARQALLELARSCEGEGQILRAQARVTLDPETDARAVEQFECAANTYEEFLAWYGDDSGSYEARFHYAQSLYEGYRFVEAAAAYTVIRDWPGVDTYQELAGCQVAKSLEAEIERRVELEELPPHALPTFDAPYGPEEDGHVSQLLPIPIPELTVELVEAYDQYVALALADVDLFSGQARFAYLAAMVHFNHRNFDEAQARLQRIVENPNYRCLADVRHAAQMLVDSYLLHGDLDNAATWTEFARLMDFDDCPGIVDWEEDVAQYQEGMQETQDYVAFLEAASLFDQGHYQAAADGFLRIAERTPTRTYAAEALFHAGLALERALDHSGAVRAYEQFLEEFADLDRVEAVVTRLAEIHADLFDFENATNYYAILAGLSEDVEHVQRALLEQARLHEYLNQLDLSAAAYLELAERFPEQLDAPWALYRAGRLFERAGEYVAMQNAWSLLRINYGGETDESLIDAMVIDTLARTAGYYTTIERDAVTAAEYYQEVLHEFAARNATDPDSIYSAAQAQFELAEMSFDTWNSGSISGSIGERRTALGQMFIEDVPNLVNAYAEVYEIGSSEWTVAAYVMIGHVYLAYADKLYSACIGELDCGFRDELEETISRCEDAAIEHWIVAIEVAGRDGLVNEWTERANQALNRFLGDDYPIFYEEAEHLQQDHVTPLPLLLPDS